MAVTNTKSPLGFTFTETMRGYIASGELDYRAAESIGRRQGDAFRFILTVRSTDLDTFVRNPSHEAELTGTIESERFGGTRPIEPGVFNLFMENERGRKEMRYRFFFSDPNGKRYLFQGFKDVHNDYIFDFWKDTTKLFVTIREDDGGEQSVAATGILYIRPSDLVPQVLSMRGVNARSIVQHARAIVRFGLFFTERMLDEYLPFKLPSALRGGQSTTTTRR